MKGLRPELAWPPQVGSYLTVRTCGREPSWESRYVQQRRKRRHPPTTKVTVPSRATLPSKVTLNYTRTTLVSQETPPSRVPPPSRVTRACTATGLLCDRSVAKRAIGVSPSGLRGEHLALVRLSRRPSTLGGGSRVDPLGDRHVVTCNMLTCTCTCTCYMYMYM